MIVLETDRLRVRDHLESDLADLHRLLSDGDVMRYLPGIRCVSLAQSERNLREALEQARRADRTKYYFALAEKNSDRYVGEVGVTIVEPGLGGLGYFIHREFWGRGYVTEAVRAVLRLCFETLRLHKVASGCLTENAASERVMVKAGLRKEACLREHVCHEGVWKDRVEYGLLRTEWIARAQSGGGRESPRDRERGAVVEAVRALFAYNGWANGRVLDAVEGLTVEEASSELGGSFPSIQATLVHILWVERLFAQRCQGRSTSSVAAPPSETTIAEMRKAWEELDAERRGFLEGLQQSEMEGRLLYLDTKGRQVEVKLWQALFQSINHSTFHRGQIVTKFRQLGKSPPLTDFILYCR
jgi:ribosomal-protein-alanine N-acetyltransferase